MGDLAGDEPVVDVAPVAAPADLPLAAQLRPGDTVGFRRAR